MNSSTPDNVPTHNMAEQNNKTSLDASASTSAPSMAKNSGEPAGSFPWFDLSRELRDMIYEQPCLLEEKVICEPREKRDDDNYHSDLARRIRMVATKPRVNLKLVSHQFGDEYNERCDSQNRLFVRANPENLEYEFLPKDSALHLNVLHLHLGEEWDIAGFSEQSKLQELEDVKWRVTKKCLELPSLRALYLKLYVGNCNIKVVALEEWLRSMVKMPKLEGLKIISCDDPAKCWDLSARKFVLVDWKSEENKLPTVITGPASAVEYAESCCDGLSYQGPRVGEVVWDEDGNYLGQIGEDREVFMPIPSEFLWDAGLHQSEDEGIPPDLLRAAGLGSWVDGFPDEVDEKDVDADLSAMSLGASGDNKVSQSGDANMSGVDSDDNATEEHKELDNGNAIPHAEDKGMSRYYYGNMDGAMDDVEEYISAAAVADTNAPAPASHDEAKESDDDLAKRFDFFGLSRELRDMIYAQPGMTQEKILDDDDFYGEYGNGNKFYMTITKPRASLCLLSKDFSVEYIPVCEDREELFIRTSQDLYGDEVQTPLSVGVDLKNVKSLKLQMGDWSFGGGAGWLYIRGDASRRSKQALAALEKFQRWLADLCAQMPCLRTISLKLYVDCMPVIGEAVFQGWVRSFASFEKLEQLKVVGIVDESRWDLRSKYHLYLDWKAGDAEEPTIFEDRPEYAESCCEGLRWGERPWDDDSDFDCDGNHISDKNFKDHKLKSARWGFDHRLLKHYYSYPKSDNEWECDAGDIDPADSPEHNIALDASTLSSHDQGEIEHFYGSEDAIRGYISNVEETETDAITSTAPPKGKQTPPLPEYINGGLNVFRANAFDTSAEHENRDNSSLSADTALLPTSYYTTHNPPGDNSHNPTTKNRVDGLRHRFLHRANPQTKTRFRFPRT